MNRFSAYSDFRYNRNVIAVKNTEEFEAFREFIRDCDDEGLDLDRLFRDKIPDYDEMCRMVRINYEDPDLIMFEVHDAGEFGCSITWSGAENYDSNVEWYGVEPINMEDIM